MTIDQMWSNCNPGGGFDVDDINNINEQDTLSADDQESNSSSDDNPHSRANIFAPPVSDPPQYCKPSKDPCTVSYWNNADWTCDWKFQKDGNPCEIKNELGECYKGSCEVSYTGELLPKYLISTIIYAPPGNNGSRVSKLVYKRGESFGQTLSLSESFTNTNTVSFDMNLGPGGALGGINLNTKYTDEWGTKDESMTDVSMSFNQEKEFIGTGYLGINHDYDQIYVFLNPKIITIVTNLGRVKWFLGARPMPNGTIHKYDAPVYVGEFKGNFDWDTGIQQSLIKAGIKTSDYKTILSVNPFSYDNTAFPDAKRYKPAFEKYGSGEGVYPYRTSPTPVNTNVTISKSRSDKASHTDNSMYSVEFSYSGGVKWTSLLETKLKYSNKITVTNSNTSEVRGATTSGVVLSFPEPPKGYNGPRWLGVYVDTVYKTYLFQTINPPPKR